jgi:hypothetical protein
MNKNGVEDHVTRGTTLLSPLGEFITAKQFKINVPPIFEIKEGVVIPSDADVTGSLTVKTHTLKRLAAAALAAGSWEELPPIPFISAYNAVFNGAGLAFIIVINDVYLNLPGEFNFNLLEGDPMYHEFPFLVAGKSVIGGAPINRETTKALGI